jgi:hypothetical protein
MPLQLSQFKLFRSVLEIRYAQSFLVWDHAGLAWHQLRARFPELKLRSAQPNQQTVLLSKNLLASISLENANITAYGGDAELDAFSTSCEAFFPLVIKQLDISDLTRIGLRIVSQRTFQTKEEAAQFAFTQIPGMQRTGKYFNIEGKLLDPELALRWEGEVTGVLVKMLPVQQKLDADIPPEFPDIESIHIERYGVLLDVDYYAHGDFCSFFDRER